MSGLLRKQSKKVSTKSSCSTSAAKSPNALPQISSPSKTTRSLLPRSPPAALKASPAASSWKSLRKRVFPSSDRKSTRLNSSHGYISYAVFCLKKKKNHYNGCSLYLVAADVQPLSALYDEVRRLLCC